MTMQPCTLTFEHKIHFTQSRHGRKQMARGDTPIVIEAPMGRIPRIARIMALAIRFEKLVSQGEVRDYADLARLGHVTRARVTQIMNLLNLAPDVQEELLFLRPIVSGRDQIKEWQVRPIAAEPNWMNQRRMWRTLQKQS